MVMNKEDCYDYRKGNRTDTEFKSNIIQSIKLEDKYIRMFVEAHNDRRCKKELSFKPLGNKTFKNKLVKELDDVNKVVKPDYLMSRNWDGSQEIKKQFPAEVQTCKSLEPIKCYIRKHKIFHFLNYCYDSVTERCIDDKCHILFVIGVAHLGLEKYSFLKPKFLEYIIVNGIIYPNIYQGKPCYWFNYNDVEWKTFNGRNKQQRLDDEYDI